MKRVYEVHFQHRLYNNDDHKPWVIARSAEEAQRKGKRYLRQVKLPHTQMTMVGVRQLGTIEVE